MFLTGRQLAKLAYEVGGFRGADLLYAVRIMLGESGGNTLATHRNSDSRRTLDRGLWQFNDYWFRDKRNPADPLYVSDAAAFDPYTSTMKARAVWQAQGRTFAPAWGRKWHPEKDGAARKAIAAYLGAPYAAALPPKSDGAPVGAIILGLAACGAVVWWSRDRARGKSRR